MNGLYGGQFVGYRVPTQEEKDAALLSATVVIDANVLLDLYRYRPQTSQDLIAILGAFGERLVVPVQAVTEFWRQRSRNQASPEAATRAVREAINKASRGLHDAIVQWSKLVGLSESERDHLTLKAETGLKDVLSVVEGAVDDPDDYHTGDSVLSRLAALLEGKVTKPLSRELWEECVREGRRRNEAEQPPGYLDADKEESSDRPEGAAGDYLVWYQAMRCAQDRQTDLLIVTRDEKEDWWWRRGPEFVGPRPELTVEFHEATGHQLFMMRPTELLERAPDVLKVKVDAASPLDASRVAKDAGAVDLWTAEGVAALLDRLDVNAPVQAAALRLALPETDGKVMREKIYELGDYDEERVLRGFSRPFRRFTEALQAEGLVAANVRPIFVARYPDGERASYFSVPPEVAQIMADLRRSSAEKPGRPSATPEG